MSAWKVCALAAALLVPIIGIAADIDAPEAGFRDPPSAARPRVWWHWMNGNVTQAGITEDLRWMKRVGIGGLRNFDVSLGTPQVVEKRLAFMTPEWRDAFRHAASLADELDLELAIATSAGWSQSGGPWVAAAQAMKKVVWSTTLVEGGRRVVTDLPASPAVAGRFQDVEYPSRTSTPRPPFYVDTKELAFRAPHDEVAERAVAARIRSPSGDLARASAACPFAVLETEVPNVSRDEAGMHILHWKGVSLSYGPISVFNVDVKVILEKGTFSASYSVTNNSRWARQKTRVYLYFGTPTFSAAEDSSSVSAGLLGTTGSPGELGGLTPECRLYERTNYPSKSFGDVTSRHSLKPGLTENAVVEGSLKLRGARELMNEAAETLALNPPKLSVMISAQEARERH
jgi:hypothetical protein